MWLFFYNSCYIRVKRLFSLLYTHVQQHILKAHFILLETDLSKSHSFTFNDDFISFFFSVLFIELQKQFELSTYGQP